MSKTKEQILKIIESGESKNVQFKEQAVRPESIKLKQFARNQTIMSYLVGYNYTEQRGEGIIKMIDAMLGAGLPEPVFQEVENEFCVTFYNKTTDEKSYD